MATGILHQSQSFYDFDGRPRFALLPLQADSSAPQVTGTEWATGMLMPDQITPSRLQHFQEDQYDLREESHLVRFLKALLGESGVGQLRKRYSICQFQGALQGTHFYDLDRFYGAIFGISRFVNEALPVNPMDSCCTEEEWDEVQSKDAAYRDRIFKLAQAINLGGTLPGLRQAAEALTEVECDVYETWSLLDTYGDTGNTGRLWDDVEDLGTWDDIKAQRMSWFEIEDITVIGRSEVNTRSEVIVRPKKDYDRMAYEDGPEEAARQKAEDMNAIIRVLHILKPASVLLTVDPEGVAMHTPAEIAYMEADSNYWEVSTKVVPRPSIRLSGIDPYPRSLRQQLKNVLWGDKRSLPKPPFNVRQAAQWSYNPEIVSVRGYSYMPGEDFEKDEPGEGPIIDRTPGHLVTYQDGSKERFSINRAILDPRRALAARYASDGILLSHPYAGDRKKVDTHG